VTEQSGGRILTGVTLAELLFDAETPVVAPKPAAEAGKEEESKEGNAPRCIGVTLADKREIKFDMKKFKKEPIEPAIISMLGLVTTFIRLLPEDIRLRHKVPRGLPALTERRPVFKALFGLTGSAADLNVTGADFYRLPGAALAQDELDPLTGQVKLGEIGWADDSKNDGEEVTVEAINADPSENPQGSDTANPSLPKKAKRRRNKFDAGVSWTHISFPSAKDPSFESRHGKITTCVMTIEADDDFVTPFETRPKLYAIQKKDPSSDDHRRLMERLKRDLLTIYPQLDGEYITFFLSYFCCDAFFSHRFFRVLCSIVGKIEVSQLIGPFHRGLSHNPERYAAKGVRPDSPYPGLFVGGSDLTIGESFGGSIVGGWLAANAVMGYTSIDHLFLQKNITSDIELFLEPPDIPDEADVAVPYEPPVVDSLQETVKQD
jgi:hypothetical protein